MGMYDDVDFECVCPVCHGKVYSFQSKDGDCTLSMVLPTEINKFYSICDRCGVEVEYNKIKDNRYQRTVTGKNSTLLDYTKIIKL